MIDGMAFTWEDKKAAANLRKHGVRVSEAAGVFLDENIVIDINSVGEYTGEERLQAVRMVYGDVMFIVYVERVTVYNDDIIRIIQPDMRQKRRRDIMLMGLYDILKAVKDPDEREAIRQDFLKRMENNRKMRGFEVDCSDIPEITDFSGFVSGKPYFDRIREHNKKLWAERKLETECE